MRRNWYFPIAIAVIFAIADFNLAHAIPASPQTLNAMISASDVQLARFGGARGGGGRAMVAGRGYGGRAFVAGRGYGGRAFVAGRGYGGRAFVAGRGYGGRAVVARRGYGGRAVVAPGRYRVGGRYYGGVWYGTGRRYWGGRWWPYGVGSCWRPSPIGYVWVCG